LPSRKGKVYCRACKVNITLATYGYSADFTKVTLAVGAASRP